MVVVLLVCGSHDSVYVVVFEWWDSPPTNLYVCR